MNTTDRPTTATYRAIYERDPEGMWLVELAELPQVHTYGRTLAKARAHLVDATALWLDTGPEGLMFTEQGRLPRGVQASVTRARRERRRSEQASEAAAVATQVAARSLVAAAGLSVRDAADLLGLSHQRVQQLLAAPVSEASEQRRAEPHAAADHDRSTARRHHSAP
ncbi:MAG: type II toxin-antitoxin system HicB family antitoxin [Acidimicrobiales bacterium]